jgi:hypothetical protein
MLSPRELFDIELTAGIGDTPVTLRRHQYEELIAAYRNVVTENLKLKDELASYSDDQKKDEV